MNAWAEIEHASTNAILDWAESQPSAKAMANCGQDAEWHAEGDVWTQTQDGRVAECIFVLAVTSRSMQPTQFFKLGSDGSNSSPILVHASKWCISSRLFRSSTSRMSAALQQCQTW